MSATAGGGEPGRVAPAERHLGFTIVATAATLLVGALAWVSGGPVQVEPGSSLPGIESEAFVDIVAAVYPIVWYVQVVAACALALLLTWKAGGRREARLLVVFLLGLAMPGSDRALDPLGVPDWAGMLMVFGGLWASAAAFLRFAAVFPHPLEAQHLPARSTRRLRRALAAIDRASLRPAVVWTVAGVCALLIGLGTALDDTALESAGSWLMVLALAAWPLVLLQGARVLLRGYRLADPPDRRRALWMVAGLTGSALLLVFALLVVPLLGSALLALSPEIFSLAVLTPILLVPFAPLLVLAGVAVGVFYSGAIDPGLVIRRTTLYGLLGIIGVFAFAAIEELVASFLVDRLGLPDSTGPIMAGGTVAVVVGVLHDRFKRLVRRRPESVAHE